MQKAITNYLKKYRKDIEDGELKEFTLIVPNLLNALPIKEENKTNRGIIEYVDFELKLNAYNDDLEFEPKLLYKAIEKTEKIEKEEFYNEVIEHLMDIIDHQEKCINKIKYCIEDYEC